MQRYSRLRLAVLVALSLTTTVQAQNNSGQSVEELRNTLVSVMEALVQKGLLTREQAQQIVSNAQTKAAADAQQKAEQEAAEKDAVVVTRIPETVKQDIVKQVGEQVRPLVTQDVLADAKSKQWGVPGAMPDWLSRIEWSGDVRVRGQQDTFVDTNIPNLALNYQAINEAGTLSGAGIDAYHNVTENRTRMRLRARLAMEARVTKGVSATVRLATGSLKDPVSTNQTLGQSGNRYQFAVDQANIVYSAAGSGQIPWMKLAVGRIASPWISTDLVWDQDLNFEGVAGTWRYVMEKNTTLPRNVYLTLGAFPLQEFQLSDQDKWLYGGQLGIDLPWDGGGRVQLAGAYYHFDNISGKKNAVDSTLLNFTAPTFMQKGNTVFDILNDTDTDTYLYALAAQYHLLDITAILELPVLRHKVSLTADYVKNIGYKKSEVLKQFGYSSLSAVPENQRLAFEPRITGWQVELAAGSRQTGRSGSWRTSVAYKHIERDAVLDAFTDSDFHLGGTAAKGYVFRTDWWFKDRNWLSLRYISTDEISHTMPGNGGVYVDAAPFGVDSVLLDINTQF